jgi:hypothetical protein
MRVSRKNQSNSNSSPIVSKLSSLNNDANWRNYNGNSINDLVKLPELNPLYNPDAWISYSPDYNNLFPEVIYNLSHANLHAACIRGKSNYTFGRGLDIEALGGSKNLLKALFPKTPFGKSLEDTLAEWIKDYYIYNTYAFSVHWNVTFQSEVETKAEIERIEYVDPRLVRFAVPESGYHPTHVYLSADWSRKYYDSKYSPQKYTLFTGEYKGESTEIYYYTGGIIGGNIYPLPTYWGAVHDIQTSIIYPETIHDIARKGIAMPTLFKVPDGDKLSPEEKRKIETLIDQSYGRANASSKYLFLYGKGTMEGTQIYPEVEQSSPPEPGRLISEVRSSIEVSIIQGHGMDASLMGIFPDSNFTSQAEVLRVAITLAEINVFSKARLRVLEGLKWALSTRKDFPLSELSIIPPDYETIYAPTLRTPNNRI